MLIEFRVENHRSLRDEQVLTFEADPSLEEDARVRRVPGHDKGLLTSVGIYGANASGKSNVLHALAFMRDAVLNSHRLWMPEAQIPRDPFAWGDRTNEPSLFQITMALAGHVFEYGLVVDDAQVVEEWLHRRSSETNTVLFEREGMNFVFGESFEGENRIISELTRPNSLYVSAGAQSHHPVLTSVFSWFDKLILANVDPNGYSVLHDLLSAQLGFHSLPRKNVEYVHVMLAEPIREFLRASDLGIIDFKIQDAELPGLRGKYQRIFLRHEGGGETSWLPLEEESHGTQAMFLLAPKVIDALQKGGVLVIDEIESGFHPLIARWIISKFHGRKTNVHNAQLAYTTHDTNLLGAVGGTPLRRDQIWLTEKTREGTTLLNPLTDFVARPAENVELGYLQGRYGAIPMLGRLLGKDE